MRKYILLIAAAFTLQTASAQIPGYQGKKFIIKYDCGIMHPAIVGRSGKLPMLYHGLAMDYVVARAWTVGLKGNFMTYKSAPDRISFYQSKYYSSDADINYKDYTGKYTQVTVGFYAKKFAIRRGYLAPMGRYIVLGVYYQYAVDAFPSVGEGASNGSYVIQNKKAVAHFGGVTVGMGRNFIVARRMVLDLGFTLNVAPVAHVIFDDNRYGIYRDLMLRNLLQIHLGIGALAF